MDAILVPLTEREREALIELANRMDLSQERVMIQALRHYQEVTMSTVTWDDLERTALETYGGGYREQNKLDAFHHGMRTVFSMLKGGFPCPPKLKETDR
jgi:hypothetical protein